MNIPKIHIIPVIVVLVSISQPYIPSSAIIQEQKQHKENSTIKELSFDASLDANILRKVLHGFGRNETTVIKVLTKRTATQRQKIVQAFKSDYNKNLVEKLMHIISGRFKDVILALLTPKYEFLAKTLNRAIRGMESNKQPLIDILCTLRPKSEINEISFTYEILFKKTLEAHIVKATTGRFRKLLVSLNQGNRNEHENSTFQKALKDAQVLYQAAKSSVFIEILTKRSFPPITLLLHQYERQYSHSLEKAVEELFSGNFKRGLLAIIKIARNPGKYWAERLHESLINVSGPIEDDLIFILVTRAEIDLENIKQEYRIMYHRTLAQHVSENTHGDYKNTLLALIGASETNDFLLES